MDETLSVEDVEQGLRGGLSGNPWHEAHAIVVAGTAR
jgi:hypothetical protein